MLLSKLTNIFKFLAEHNAEHARETEFYRFTDAVTKFAFRQAWETFEAARPILLGEIGEIILPYHKMGAIDSIDLFGLDELLMFAFYHRNRHLYRNVVDVGANIGLHSILLAKCGFTVEAWEPDPAHFTILQDNLRRNNVAQSVTPFLKAVSDRAGQTEFVRVLGNTTSSHLAGAKANPYGELERFPVDLDDFRAIALRADLAKIDAEGHEAVILAAVPLERWASLDAFVEIGTPETAAQVFEYFSGTSVRIFAQKLGWKQVEGVAGMPDSYREGGIFLSTKTAMPW